jgi:hypothetical protein
MLSLGAVLAMALVLGPAQGSNGQSSAADIAIDGSKDPAKLPNWVVWEHGFTVLGVWAGRDSGFNHGLRLVMTPKEFALLEREALAQRDRRATAARAIEELRPLWEKADRNDSKVVAFFNRKQQEINVTYRRATLDARDRVLAGLGAVAQSALMTWMDDERASIKATIPMEDLADWRAPE